MVVRFIVDNPGWWLFHCHVEIDISSGMAAVIRALPNELISPADNNNNNNINTCMPTGSSTSSFNMNGFSVLVMGLIITLLLFQTEIDLF